MDMTDIIKEKFNCGCSKIIALWVFIAILILAAVLETLGIFGIGSFIFLILLGFFLLLIL